MSINEDGSGQVAVSVTGAGLSWATPPGSHGDKNAMAIAVPLEGGAPITVCDNCGFGFGISRFSVPMLSWSLDGKWVYVSRRYFPFGSSKTAVIPVKFGDAPPTFTRASAAKRISLGYPARV